MYYRSFYVDRSLMKRFLFESKTQIVYMVKWCRTHACTSNPGWILFSHGYHSQGSQLLSTSHYFLHILYIFSISFTIGCDEISYTVGKLSALSSQNIGMIFRCFLSQNNIDSMHSITPFWHSFILCPYKLMSLKHWLII